MRRLGFVFAVGAIVACNDASPPPQTPVQPQATAQPQYPQYPQQQYPQQQYPQQQYPQQQYPQQPYPQQPYPQQPYPQQPPQPQAQPAQRPLLPPLVGTASMQSEVRSVLAELIASLGSVNAARVRGIPLVFDPTPEVNAYAGCDERGAPFLAGTAGLLDAVDAIAQTKATDELFGTQTYDAYTGAVIPELVKSDKARAGLPPGLIPAQYGPDPRRWSRAREIFDEIVAFTFGHELGHHYLGHTGCANGQPMGVGPSIAVLGNIATAIVPGINQPNEIAADAAGASNAMDTGLARRPSYRWSERGGLTLIDFFARLERAAGVNPLSPSALFLRTHPNPGVRLPLVQVVAQNWYIQHPGVTGP